MRRGLKVRMILWVMGLGAVLAACQSAGVTGTPTATQGATVGTEDALATGRAEALATLYAWATASAVPPYASQPITPGPTPTPTSTPDLGPLLISQPPSLFRGVAPLGAMARLGQGSLYAVRSSPDGEYIAVGGSMGVTVYETDGFEQVWYGRSPARVSQLEWSPNGKRIAASLDDGTIIVWETLHGSRVFKLSGGSASLAWSPDSQWLLSASEYGTAYIWDAATGAQLHRLKASEVFAPPGRGIGWMLAALSPDGRLVATTYQIGGGDTFYYYNEILIWDAVTSEHLSTLVGPTSLQVAWSPDSKFLASFGDGALVIWDVENAEVVKRLTASYMLGYQWDIYFIADILWSPDGKWIASSSAYDSTIVFDVATGSSLPPLGQEERLVGWSPDSAKYATLDLISRLFVRDTLSSAVLSTLVGIRREAGFSPDWSRFYGWTGEEGETLAMWDVQTGELHDMVVTGTRWVQSVAWSPDGARLATGSVSFEGNTVVIWDVTTGEAIRAVNPEVTSREAKTQVAWSLDGNILAIGADGVTLLDAETGRNVGMLGTGRVASLAWSSNDGRLAVAGDQTGLSIWSPMTGEILLNLVRPNEEIVRIAAWSADSRLIASTGRDGQVDVWDAETGQSLHTFDTELLSVTSIAFSPDSSLVAAAARDWGEDSEVLVWDVETKALLLTLREPSGQMGGWYGITSIAWAPDGSMIAAAYGIPPDEMFGMGFSVGSPGAVVVWDARTGQKLNSFYGHNAAVQSVAFSPDGSLLASGSLDGTVLLWDVGQ